LSDHHPDFQPRRLSRRKARAGIRHTLIALLWMLSLLVAPGTGEAQFSVSHEEEGLRFTLTVDQLVIGLPDSIHVSYTVENLADSSRSLALCCCGVEFFAIRDSSCTYDDLSTEPTCQIAGCDACTVCFPLGVCGEEPCELLPLAAGGKQVLTWHWDRVVCEGDTGSDLILGNVGTFRIVAGYNRCDPPGLAQVLSIPVEVLKVIPVQPTSWGRLKAGYGDFRGPEEAPPDPNMDQDP
jgi:hypothetical protein